MGWVDMKQWTVNFLLGFDQWINTWFGGDPDETISSRAGKSEGFHWWATSLCWVLDKLDDNHCKDAIEHDEGEPDHHH